MSTETRRSFLARTAAAAALAGAGAGRVAAAAAQPAPSKASRAPLIVSTWPFGRPANDKALAVLLSGKSGLDAIEQGIGVTEADPENLYVGLAGIPNADGVVQLDACIMSGPGHAGGSVAGVSGFRHPISIARRVMETTPHVLLVGAGAEKFARENGFEEGPLVGDKQRAEWEKWRAAHPRPRQKGHDTIAMVLLTSDGHLFGGCSTSGLSYKLAGRVGDSPILGSGLYVDDEVGAAGATGVGENIMRYCGSFQVVECMRRGMHPREACLETIRRIARVDPKGANLSINFIAIDRKGRYGGAGSGPGFEFAVANQETSLVYSGAAFDSSRKGPPGSASPP